MAPRVKKHRLWPPALPNHSHALPHKPAQSALPPCPTGRDRLWPSGIHTEAELSGQAGQPRETLSPDVCLSPHAPRSRWGPRPLRSRTVSSHKTNRWPGAMFSNRTLARGALAQCSRLRWAGPTLRGADTEEWAELRLCLQLPWSKFVHSIPTG